MAANGTQATFKRCGLMSASGLFSDLYPSSFPLVMPHRRIWPLGQMQQLRRPAFSLVAARAVHLSGDDVGRVLVALKI
jgi:hypothetical protein